MKMKWLSLMAFFLLSALFGAEAQTINAASCSASDVQTAFNSVTSSITTVNIPAGTCNWSGQVTLTVPSGSTTLTIAGKSTTNGTCAPSGSCTATDNTVIVDNDTTDTNSLLMITTAAASSYFRFTGVTFEGGSGGVKNNGIVSFGGFTQNMRFDHNHITTQTYSPTINQAMMRFTNWIYGVVDHNEFDLESIGNGVTVWMDEYNNDTAGFGDDAWAASTAFGSSAFMFIENNLFDTQSTNPYGTANDCSHGGRFVWRYNIMNGPSVQTHPTGGSGRARGCRAWEVYENTFSGNNSGGGQYANFNLFFMSSGTGLLWGNSATTGYTNFVSIHSMQVDNSTYPESAAPAGWGYCGTSSGLSGDGSAWDGPSPSGYPCIDQPGSGKGDLLQGQFPNACDVTAGPCASSNYNGSITNEAREPIYEWMNIYTPVPGAGGVYWANYEPSVLLQNRDFYLWCNASSASGCASSFAGASGTGSGLLSARPSTCTPKVAYWATDTTTLYQCSSTNTWTSYYTPYTYPHPLVRGSAKAPAAPMALQAIVN
jgi:hypothetical protein